MRFPMIILCLVLLGATKLPAASASPANKKFSPRKLKKEITRLLDGPELVQGFAGVMVYSLDRGKTLYSLNPQKNFRPASNLKIITTLAGMEFLGPEFRYVTQFLRSGPIEAGVLKGDLIVVGDGDPSFSGNYDEWTTTETMLSMLVDRIAALGVHKIEGNIVGLTEAFDEQKLGYSWEWDDFGTYYLVPVASLSLHNGWLELHITTDQAGLISYEVLPAPISGLQIEFQTTSDPTRPLDIDGRRALESNKIIVEGNLPPCVNKRLTLAVTDPAQQYVETLRHALAVGNITTTGTCLTTNTYNGPATHMFSHESEPLWDLSRVLMQKSQNHYADCVFKTVARVVTEDGGFKSGLEVVDGFLAEIAAPFKDNHNSLYLRDGSGLSRQNNISPVQVLSALVYGYRRPYHARWLETFPRLAEDGTLEKRGVAGGLANGRVLAKTGYLFRTRALSGYVQTLAGETLAFVFLTNNYGVPTREINAMQDRFCELLVRLKPPHGFRPPAPTNE